MCRIFAFRSILQSHVHSSLLSAENAIQKQGVLNPDGWGVAYYYNNIPHVIKSKQSAFDNKMFQKVSGVVTSNTVVAHIRKSTAGNINILNTHPFQFCRWTFAHNGNIKNLDKYRKNLTSLIKADLMPFVLGETDSELIFFILLSFIQPNQHSKLRLSIDQKIKNAINAIVNIIGDLTFNSTKNTENYLTFVLTNGQEMYAFNGGKDIFYSTHKRSCQDSKTCSHYSSICENKAKAGQMVKHLLISSYPIIMSKDQKNFSNIWTKIKPYQLLSLTQDLSFNKKILKIHLKK